MKVTFCFVPPGGGGEAEYSLAFDLPSIPQAGDYVLITRPDNPGVTEDFIVKRTWWGLMHPRTGTREEAGTRQAGSVREIYVECYFAQGPWSSDAHKESLREFENQGKEPLKLDVSCH